jgi:hypothetical protein
MIQVNTVAKKNVLGVAVLVKNHRKMQNRLPILKKESKQLDKNNTRRCSKKKNNRENLFNNNELLTGLPYDTGGIYPIYRGLYRGLHI